MDARELSAQDDFEEVLRVALGSHDRYKFSNLRVKVSKDSTDGHTVELQPVTKMQVRDQDGNVMQMALPVLPDCPICFSGGGGVTATHPVKEGDEGTVSFSASPIDNWHQQGGIQAQIDGRQHSLSDASFHPGGRSDPRKLPQVETGVHQVRTDDKKSVISHGPDGTYHKSVDPSTPAASDTYDPQKQATKYHDHNLHPVNGLLSQAVDGDTTHAVSNTHDEGPKLSAKNGSSVINAHPDGAMINAPNATLDKDTGDLTNKGKHTAGGDIMSTGGNVSAPAGTVSGASGQFAGGFLGNLSFGGGGFSGPPSSNGSLTIGGQLVAAPVIQANATYTVAQLNAMYPPAPAYEGMRSTVTDASFPTGSTDPNTQSAPQPVFMSILVGGGTAKAPAWCDGTNWLCA